MAKDKFYPEVTDPAEKVRLLRDNCDRCEEEEYTRTLSQHELDLRREKLADNCIAVDGFEESLKKIKDEFKVKIDPLKEENKTILKEVKTGVAEEVGMLYYFADHATGMMDIYDRQGELVKSRRLTAEERQGNIFAVKRISEAS